MPNPIELRQYRGKSICTLQNQVRRLNDNEYYVKSQSSEKEYRVTHLTDGWGCECPDFPYRAFTCKHIYAIQFSFDLRNQVRQNRLTISPIDSVSECAFCHSQKIRKYGIRRNKSGEIQRYLCEFCKRSFSINIGFEKMKHNPQAITTAMQLYFSGESLRNTQKSLMLLGVQVSIKTVFLWIKKYIGLMESYIQKVQPDVSETWRADEVYVKIRGNMKYLFALMDDETRYWIAQEVAQTKFTHDARHLFQMGKEITGKKPFTLITDGLQAYQDAFQKEFGVPSNRVTQPQHIREIQISGKVHNNKMERMNGEIRDREKTMRGLKTDDSPILKGMQIFHNHIRPHEGLKGRTPGEMAGITVNGENKWITLIQNASLQPKSNKENLDRFA